MAQYQYKKPRTLNWVTLLFILLGAAAAYGAWKFGPVYYHRYKVDQILQDMGMRAVDMPHLSPDARMREEQRILTLAVERLRELGIDDPKLRVYFAPDYTAIHASYVVTVNHPFDKTTTIQFHRSGRVPQ